MSSEDNPEYMLESTGHELDRLHKQHAWYMLCHNNRIVYAPIQLTTPGLRILDVGCADGTLLRELQKQVDPSATLVGVDIAKSFLPPPGEDGIKYQYYDICEPPTGELKEAFDLTHVRVVLGGAFKVGIPAAITNLASTLVPGGWLQVQELDFERNRPGLTPATADLLRVLSSMFEKMGMGPNYASTVSDGFKTAGLQNVTEQLLDLPMGKLLGHDGVARDALRAYASAIASVAAMARSLGADLPESVTDNLVERLEKEAMEEGTTLRVYMVTGQKAA